MLLMPQETDPFLVGPDQKTALEENSKESLSHVASVCFWRGEGGEGVLQSDDTHIAEPQLAARSHWAGLLERWLSRSADSQDQVKVTSGGSYLFGKGWLI